MKELFLVRGAPGAGKSTFAKTLAMRPDVPDDIVDSMKYRLLKSIRL